MKKLGVLFFMVLLAIGCYDIFEDDISEKEVELIAPADSVRTFYRNLTFAWKQLEGATGYRLVVVTPSFEKAELYVLDSLVTKNSYMLELSPGEYEWQVRPENSAYEGVYRKRQLTVLEETNQDNESNI